MHLSQVDHPRSSRGHPLGSPRSFSGNSSATGPGPSRRTIPFGRGRTPVCFDLKPHVPRRHGRDESAIMLASSGTLLSRRRPPRLVAPLQYTGLLWACDPGLAVWARRAELLAESSIGNALLIRPRAFTWRPGRKEIVGTWGGNEASDPVPESLIFC